MQNEEILGGLNLRNEICNENNLLTKPLVYKNMY